MNPSDLGLPYPKWRPMQWEAICAAVASDKKIILIDAPPGLGKTGIGVAVARLLAPEGSRCVAHYLTGTKQLQAQYLALPGVIEVKGRGNFACLEDSQTQADEAVCTAGGECEYAKSLPGCEYYDQKRAAQAAPEVVFNYAYWLRIFNPGQGWARPETLICDEAHTVKNQVRSFATIQIRYRGLALASVSQSTPATTAPFTTWQTWAAERAPEVHLAVKQAPRPLDMSDATGVRLRRALLALEAGIIALRDAQDEWVVDTTPWGLEFRPVWVHPLVPPLLSNHALGKTVYLSATILNKATFCALHGYDESQVEFVQTTSPFRISARPIRYRPVGKIGRNGDGLGALLNETRTIIRQHPDERGIIHTVSYKLAEAVVTALRADRTLAARVLTHTGRDRESSLHKFRQQPAAVLVSPSMTTGVDLPYELLRFQIITKLPFPDLSDRQIKAAMREYPCEDCAGAGAIEKLKCKACRGKGVRTEKRGQLAYNYDTVATLVQTYGRIMRAEDDAGVTYLLDENYRWFRQANRDLLPRWFTEAVIFEEQTEQTAEQLLASLMPK